LNQDHHAVIQLRGGTYKSYLEKTVPLYQFARQYRKNLVANVRLFARRTFHMQEGLRNLTRMFYRSVAENSAVPIAYRDILLTTRIMDEIFRQVYGKD
jgi:hypothetical protein